ncbi:hypothetical protein BV20DRAFT_1034436 [Pilatotrama ljubarskyi]|nr:hypothetical protein BV20DRAFT_1034436 [Pilatotrama ljubarskyi]
MRNYLHVVFQNANHSPQHTYYLLERCAADDVNISLVEARKDARMACHIKCCLVNAIVSLDSAVNHCDCMLLRVCLSSAQDPITILNIYNDSRNHAVDYLTDIAHFLPSLNLVGGDYNTHSPLWDPQYHPDPMVRTGEIIDLHARLGLCLLSPMGEPTHFPHHGDLRHTVIDLIWVPDDHDPAFRLLRSYCGSLSIAPNSDTEKEFIASIRVAMRDRLPPNIQAASPAELQEAEDTLFDCIASAWSLHATPTVICNKSPLALVNARA